MDECTHDCGSCTANCSSREGGGIQKEAANKDSHVKKVIAVVSGKGGVGKSLVTSMLAVNSRQQGYETAVLDADITGPSIPKIFGVREKALGLNEFIMPVKSRTGVKIMSINSLIENESDPVVWRGPVIAGAVKQFWTDVIWEEVDYMFVDMPPGTGDVPLTVFQSLPVDGIIIVTSPQDLVSMIVEKAAKMAKMMNIPILGLVENYSYYVCKHCGEKQYIFGESKIDSVARRFGIKNVAKLPINPAFAEMCDEGLVELGNCEGLADMFNSIK